MHLACRCYGGDLLQGRDGRSLFLLEKQMRFKERVADSLEPDYSGSPSSGSEDFVLRRK